MVDVEQPDKNVIELRPDQNMVWLTGNLGGRDSSMTMHTANNVSDTSTTMIVKEGK